jgi:hypothetical protein
VKKSRKKKDVERFKKYRNVKKNRLKKDKESIEFSCYISNVEAFIDVDCNLFVKVIRKH